MKFTILFSGSKISNDKYWVQPLAVDTVNRLTASDGAAGVLLCTGGPGSNFGPDKEQRERGFRSSSEGNPYWAGRDEPSSGR